MHSKGEDIFACLLDCLVKTSSEQRKDISLVISKILQQVCVFTRNSYIEPIWRQLIVHIQEQVKAQLAGFFNINLIVTIIDEILAELVQLFVQIVSYSEGFMIYGV